VLQATSAPPKPAEAVRQDFTILYEDEHILAVDKPSGLAIHPGSGIRGETLSIRSRISGEAGLGDAGRGVQAEPGAPARSGDQRRGGSGQDAPGDGAADRDLQRGEAHKTYLALAKGRFQRESGTIDLRLAEHQQTAASRQQRGVNLQSAVTHWKKLAGGPEATLLG